MTEAARSEACPPVICPEVWSLPWPHIKTPENLHARAKALSFEVASSLEKILPNLLLNTSGISEMKPYTDYGSKKRTIFEPAGTVLALSTLTTPERLDYAF
jgi:hypothetical protein